MPKFIMTSAGLINVAAIQSVRLASSNGYGNQSVIYLGEKDFVPVTESIEEIAALILEATNGS